MTDSSQIAKIAEEAYVYAYALLYNYQTFYTQTQDSSFGGYVGGIGRYRHYARPSTPADTDIVTPNNDTLYSWAWLDLRREPIVFQTPQFDAERYAVYQWVDLQTFIFASPGTRLNGHQPRSYLFAGPGWDGPIPDGIDEVFRPESHIVGTLTRTSVGGKEDVPIVQALQRQYVFTPLSAWTAQKPPPPAPTLHFPVWHEDVAKGPGFISYVNFLLGLTTPDPMDSDALNRFAAIGIGANRHFDPAAQDAETQQAIRQGIDRAIARLEKRTANTQGNVGLFGPRSYLKDDYEARAVGAMIGLYGQNEQEAVYFAYQADADGNPLNGASRYELRFEAPPPVSQFWSLTMYNLPQRLLVDNPIDRYSFGDRTEGLVTADDGSITVTISTEDPGSGKNWLPSPQGQPFFMVMRLYGPQQGIIDGSWPRPTPRKI